MTHDPNLVVLKFGGSSLATPEQILSVAARIADLHRQNKKLIVVTSAMGRTTDELLSLARKVSPHPNRRELDMLLTTGERVSMALMSMALHDLGCPSISFTGSQAGVMTDSSHSSARIVEIKPIRVSEALEAGKVVVLAGFQGVDPSTKEITTLGRGGSDTTAVAMAAHFNASRCEILKDVDGVYSCDPKIAPRARLYAELPLNILYEFCFWGAKVLNYRSVEWALDNHVPLFIGRSDNFQIGTRCVPQTQGSRELVGVNSHAHVLEVQTAQPPTSATSELHDFSQSLGLPSPQVLRAEAHAGGQRLLITNDRDALFDLADAIEKGGAGKSIRLLRRDISSVTETFSDAKSAIHVVEASERDARIRSLHARIEA